MRMHPLIRATCAIALTIAGAVGCGGDPADVAGEYTIAITNGANGCNFDSWTVGETNTGIPVTVTQDGAAITAEVGGLAAVALDLLLGSHVYTGSVDGSSIDLTLFGTTTAMEGNCTYTVNSHLEGDLDGDVLVGQIRYEAATNGNPDCGSLQGCATVQNFNGTRPPSAE